MNIKDRVLFCELLTGVAELYNKPLTHNALDIYWNILEKYPPEKIKQALNLHIENPDSGQFMPKPADILRYIEMSHTARAMRAWDKVVAAMSRVGAYNSIMFDDPLIHIIINEMRGWVAVCHDEQKIPFIAQEFQRRYMMYLLYSPSSPAPLYLAGIYEYQNRLHGFLDHIPKPIPFGDKEMKLLISNLTPEALQQLEKSNDNE